MFETQDHIWSCPKMLTLNYNLCLKLGLQIILGQILFELKSVLKRLKMLFWKLPGDSKSLWNLVANSCQLLCSVFGNLHQIRKNSNVSLENTNSLEKDHFSLQIWNQIFGKCLYNKWNQSYLAPFYSLSEIFGIFHKEAAKFWYFQQQMQTAM